MAFKSILTIWDGRAESRAALDAAARLAREGEAHLDVLALGLDRTPISYYSDAALQALESFQQVALEEAAKRAEEAKQALASEVFPHTVSQAAIRYAEIGDVVGRAAWRQDLVVLPKPFGPDGDEAPELVVEAALFEAPTPVLVVPPEGGETAPKRVLLAWNGSREAMRAARAALPFLAAAETTTLVIVDPGRHEGNRADPGRAMATWLSRHGVRAEISVIPDTGPSLAETLSRVARETGAGMIVMGAYGHSRIREMLLGGATRDMLKGAKLPVLMAH